MHGTYNLWLVALSLAIATFASYTALDVAARISQLSVRRLRHLWLLVGATSMGLGVWSMHFVGMLAFSLPVALGYDLTTTGYSLGIAVLVSYFALYVITGATLTPVRLLSGGVLMGLSVAGMHYTGMAAMQMQPPVRYDPLLFGLSLLVAITASSAALWIGYVLKDSDQKHIGLKRVGSSLLMGVAIAGMHYTGMAAARFPMGSICRAAHGLSSQWLATTIILFTFALLTVTLIQSRFDARTAFLARSVLQLNGKILRLASFDALTDLPNRTTLVERIERAISKAGPDGAIFAVLFMDLDRFKDINDSFGHVMGDEVLKSFSRRLRDCVRRDDTVARLGGDEFVAVLESLSSPGDAAKVAETILERMREGGWTDNQSMQVVPSIGIALFPQNGRTVEALLKHADAAMYESKRAGRGTYRFFEANMNAAAIRTMEIQRALHEALERGQFRLHFQPKFCGDTGDMTGAEALLRLNHPKLGHLSPMEFIPVAEQSGQIVRIGEWVVAETCKQIRRWASEGAMPMKIAINLSPRQLAQPDLVDKTLAILRAADVSPECIMFEITETMAMHDAPKTIEMIRKFEEHGFEIAIDDFGTGYSSLAYLQRFRVKQLKIDRFFISGLDEQGHEAGAIVSAIVALAHALRMDVVAEGVETRSQLDKLKALNCDQVQGFLLGKPLTADAFSTLLQERVTPAQHLS